MNGINILGCGHLHIGTDERAEGGRVRRFSHKCESCVKIPGKYAGSILRTKWKLGNR